MPYYPEKSPGNGPEEENEKQKKNKAKEVNKGRNYTLILPLIISTALMIYGGTRLSGYVRELSSQRETSKELKQIYEDNADQNKEADITENETAQTSSQATETAPVLNGEAGRTDPDRPTVEETAAEQKVSAAGKLPAVSYPDNPGLQVSSRFIQLRKKSGYIIGWLSMNGVDEAVVLKDNTFFLNHDAMGKKNSNGAIFIDEDTNLLTRPYTVILYGHNMKSGNMFGKLRKYRDSGYLYENLIISFDSLYEEGKYAVFAVMDFSTLPEKSGWFNLWSLASNDKAEREEAIQMLEMRSIHGSVLDVSPDEQLLLLLTCEGDEDERLMVAARRLRDGETETSLTFRKQ